MDGFIVRYLLVEFIRILNRAILNTDRTTGTLILVDVSWFLLQGDAEVPRRTLNAFNFGVRQNFYIWLPADLDQFR